MEKITLTINGQEVEATQGMVVTTESPTINDVRRMSLELLLSNHPIDSLCVATKWL